MYTRSIRAVGDTAAPASAVVAPAPFNLHDAVNSDPVTTAAAIALTYHGYRRTGSLFWALVYGVAGKWFPLEAVPIAVAQGFATKKACP